MAHVSNVLSIPRALRLFQRKRVSAVCQSTDQLFKCVYISGDGVGDVYQVSTCDPSDKLKMPAIGVIIEKESATECIVQLFGEIKGIYAGLPPNSPLYVSWSGDLSVTPPSIISGEIYIQNVGRVLSSGIPFFWPLSNLVRRYDSSTDNKALKYDQEDEVLDEITIGGPTPSTYALFNRSLIGFYDGANRVYETPEKFLPETLRVYHNGRRLKLASSPNPTYGDYYPSESGGVGTGYNTITILTFSPVQVSRLWADYYTQL